MPVVIHPMALFAVENAVRLIAAGGAHRHDNIHQATQEVLDAILDAHLAVNVDDADDEPEGTTH